MATAGSWRSGLFVAGQEYRVLKPWSGAGSALWAGSILCYDSCAYERYDSESLFRFSHASGPAGEKEDLIWRLRDNEPESMAQEYFELVASRRST